jgi:N-sulfoglucosamine sulfohydrolase
MGIPISRRQAIARTSVAVGGALLGNLSSALAQAPGSGAKANRRPNILLMVTCSWSGPGSEASDMAGLNMPTLARLRRDGTSYDNAFSASPAVLFDYVDLLKKSGYAVPPHQALGSMDFETFLGQRPAGKPFFYRFDSKNTPPAHDYDLTGFDVPPYLPDTPAVRKDIAYYRRRMEEFDRDAGLLVDRLERDRELADTLVIVMGESSWPFPRAKGTLYDAGRRVPLVVMHLAAAPRGKISKAVVSTADLPMTFLKAAKLNRFAVNKAPTRTPLPLSDADANANANANATQRSLVSGTERHTEYPSRAIRTQQYLYIRNLYPDRWPVGAPAAQAVTPFQLDTDTDAAFPGIATGPAKTAMIVGRGNPVIDRILDLATAKRPAAELYDVHADPHQLSNLTADPALKSIANELDKQLLAELKRTNDPQAALIGPIVWQTVPARS